MCVDVKQISHSSGTCALQPVSRRRIKVCREPYLTLSLQILLVQQQVFLHWALCFKANWDVSDMHITNWCCAVLAGQGSACRKPLLADVASSCANHSHFELESLIWLLQPLSNDDDANYCPYIKPAFFHVFLSKKRKLFIWNTRHVLFLGYSCHGPMCKRCRADGHWISVKWGCCLGSSPFLLS